MNITKLAAISALTLGLVACGSEAPEGKSPEEIAQAAQDMVKPLAGQYTSKTELLEFEVPGLPAEQSDQLRGMMASSMVAEENSYCLTQEEVDKGFEDAVKKMGEGNGGMQCKFSEFDASGNTLDSTMACTADGGMTATMDMDGTITPESSEMQLSMTAKAAAIPGGEMRMKMSLKSTRTGDCS